MSRIASAEAVSFEALREGMCAGFADYPVPLAPSAEVFAVMMRQRGLDRSMSRVLVEDGVVQAIWLVAVEGTRAYLIASATRPERRGWGIARSLAEDCLEGLRGAGVTRFQTEVMEENAPAQDLYARLGMVPNRLLDCYVLPQALAATSGLAVERAAWGEIAPSVAGCRDWAPSWQNDDRALGRVADDLRVTVLRDAQGLAGYAAVIGPLGGLAQIAVRKDRRGQGLGRALVAACVQGCDNSLRLLNADRADAGFAAFMKRIGAQRIVGQIELAGSV